MITNMPYASWKYPEARATELAVFVPGFGDTVGGPIGTRLCQGLGRRGIAFLGVESSDPVPGASNIRVAVPPSEQTARVIQALDRFQNSAPIRHLVGYSQGGWAAAEATLLATDEEIDLGGGRTVTIATPYTAAADRLRPRMQPIESIPGLPPVFPTDGINRAITVGRNTVLLSDSYLEESAASPHRLLTAVFEDHNSGVVLAGQDNVLNGEQHAIKAACAAVAESRVTMIPGADHEFTHRRPQMADAVIGYLATGAFLPPNQNL